MKLVVPLTVGAVTTEDGTVIPSIEMNQKPCASTINITAKYQIPLGLLGQKLVWTNAMDGFPSPGATSQVFLSVGETVLCQVQGSPDGNVTNVGGKYVMQLPTLEKIVQGLNAQARPLKESLQSDDPPAIHLNILFYDNELVIEKEIVEVKPSSSDPNVRRVENIIRALIEESESDETKSASIFGMLIGPVLTEAPDFVDDASSHDKVEHCLAIVRDEITGSDGSSKASQLTSPLEDILREVNEAALDKINEEPAN